MGYFLKTHTCIYANDYKWKDFKRKPEKEGRDAQESCQFFFQSQLNITFHENFAEKNTIFPSEAKIILVNNSLCLCSVLGKDHAGREKGKKQKNKKCLHLTEKQSNISSLRYAY